MFFNFGFILLKILWLIKKPRVVVLSRLFHYPLTSTFTLHTGEKFVLRKDMNADLSMMAEVFYDHQYDPIFFSLNKESVVFDVGAHVGYFSVYAGYRAKEVHSFEPFSKNYHGLERNIKLNKLSNVTINNIALGKKSGTVSFYEHNEHTGCHSLYQRAGIGASHTVDQYTLHDYMDKHNINQIDLLKLDCEGAEYDILLNLPSSYFPQIKKICMEVHPDVTNMPAQKIIDVLQKHGYLVYGTDGFIYAILYNQK